METDEAGLKERLKSALWMSVGQIVDEETMKLGVNATPQFIGALTEMVWAQIDLALVYRPRRSRTVIACCVHLEGVLATDYVTETVSQDLETFAKHAGRSTVNVTDVMLLARRNEGLKSILLAFVEQQKSSEETF
ncbi:hypothetical protein N7523_000174 [Penicillium sp. IBT 18751x]|nr:hypothetical protein N7523_000174 [Penicillium sp. IBT 18751x]